MRGAIQTLKAIGFLDPETFKGSGYRATEVGLHRKPVLFRFGEGYREAFAKANTQAQALRGGAAPARRQNVVLPIASRPPMLVHQLAQKQNPPGRVLFMGEQRAPTETDPILEAALNRLKEKVFGKAEGRTTEPPHHQNVSPQQARGGH